MATAETKSLQKKDESGSKLTNSEQVISGLLKIESNDNSKRHWEGNDFSRAAEAQKKVIMRLQTQKP